MKFSLIILFILVNVTSAKAQFVSADEIRGAVRSYLLEQLGRNKDDVDIEFRSAISAIAVPSESFRIIAGSGTPRQLRGNVSVPVDVTSKDSVVRRMLISVRLRTFGSVMVAARQLARGVELTELDFIPQRIETTSSPDDRIIDSRSFAGMQTTKIITAGSILRECFLSPIPIIRQGDRVNLTVRSGRVVLRSEAIARESGGKGTVISVQVAGASERLRGRIVAPDTVELQAN
jgi:flagella basal body P-ring formation protein FlgA